MNIYRTEIHGHRLEARAGDWGGEQVLVDGCIVSNRPLAGLRKTSHFFELADESGRPRRLEVRWMDLSKLGLGRYRVVISVDGVERCRLEPVDTRKSPVVCANCGYSLTGLPVDNSEIRCPECGRHTSALSLER